MSDEPLTTEKLLLEDVRRAWKRYRDLLEQAKGISDQLQWLSDSLLDVMATLGSLETNLLRMQSLLDISKKKAESCAAR